MFFVVIICSLFSFASAKFFCVGTFSLCLCDKTELICENQNFTLNYMNEKKWFHELDISIENIIFTGNRIHTLKKNMFSKHNNVHKLNLSFNYIQTIDTNAFNYLSNLTELILDHNNWNILTNDISIGLFKNLVSLKSLSLNSAFDPDEGKMWLMRNLSRIFNDSLQHLEYLSLESNNLVAFDNSMFCHMVSLTTLKLSHNSLHHLNFNIPCTNVHRLFVDHNSLRYLTNKSMTALSEHSSIKHLDLQENPFVCDCHMIAFRNWLKSTEIRIPNYENFKCHLVTSPKRTSSKVGIYNISDQELICRFSKDSLFSSPMTAAYISLGIIIGLIGIVIVVVIFVTRKRLVRFFNRLDYTEIVRSDSVA